MIIKAFKKLKDDGLGSFLTAMGDKVRRRIQSNALRNDNTIPLWQSVLLETISDCNRDCWFCMRNKDRSGIRKDKYGRHTVKKMPTWKVVHVLEQLEDLGYAGRVGFHRNNEPLLDERVYGFALMAKQCGLSPYIYTNADLIRKGSQEFADLIAECLDFIVMGQYDFSNEEERRQDQLELTFKMRKAKKIKFSGGPRVPDVNMDEEKFKEKYECAIDDFAKQAYGKSCVEPLIRLIIRYDGEVIQCCRTDTVSIGNVYKNSIKEIWWSESHIKFVKDLSKPGNRYKYEFCKMCPSGGDYPCDIRQKINEERGAKKDYYYFTPKWIKKEVHK